MRKSMVLVAAFAMLFFISDAAWARLVQLGNHTAGQIKAACDKAGGTFTQDSGGYGCGKGNCDGKGGLCSVGCTNGGKCTGLVPGRIAPGKSPLGVLQTSPGVRRVRAPNAKVTTTTTLRAVHRPASVVDQHGMSGTGRRR